MLFFCNFAKSIFNFIVMKNFLLLLLTIFSVTFNVKAQVKTTTKMVDTINYLGYKKMVGSPKSSGVKLVPSFVGLDSIRIPLAYQKFKNTSKFLLKEIAIPMVSLNKKIANVSVKVNNKELTLGESILNVAFHATDLTTYWFKFKTPIEITGDYQIYIQPITYADSIYLPTSGDFVNSSIKANIVADKLTIVSDKGNLGNSFWVGQDITGNGILNGTKVIAFNSVKNEYTLNNSMQLSSVVVTGINKTFGNNDGGFLFFTSPLDKTLFPAKVPDVKVQAVPSYQSLSWDALKKESIYEHDFVMYPVVEYDWINTPQNTAVCLGDSKTITITADKKAYANYVANPLFNKSAFIQKYMGLGKSSGNFYGRITTGKENLKDTIDVNDNNLSYSVTYLNDNANDTISVIETIQTYGYSISKMQTQVNKILVSSKLTSNASVTSPILCNGATGSITVSGSGGYASLLGLGVMAEVKAGNPSYTITDANRCKSTATVSVTEPTLISISGTPTSESTCSANDAKIDISVSGANAPYSYKWSNNATTKNISSLSAGLFTVTVTDKNNCIKSKDFIISSIGAPVVSATLSEAIKCFGGVAKVNVSVVSGGQANFTGIGIITGQKSGDNFYTVTDANNCKGVAKLTITEPTQLVATAIVSDSIKCHGGDAKVLVSAIGGTTNYSGIGEMTGVKAGTKNYTVTDANNCSSVVNIVIAEPLALKAKASVKSAIACNDGKGVINVSVLGGTSPYVGVGDKTDVHAGPIAFNVVDANGCVDTAKIVITHPDKLQIVRFSVNATNDTIKDGKAIVNVTGGVLPYSFVWKDNETLKLLNTNNDTVIVKTGAYAISVTDKNGCTAKTSVTVDASHFVSLGKMSISSLKLYPNPVRDNLSIHLNVANETTIKLMTLTGQQIMSKIIQGNSETKMDMSEYSAGFYLLHFENSAGEFIQKIEKL